MLAEEFSRRADQQALLLDEYRGEAFVQNVEVGQRLFRMVREAGHERAENRWLMFLGALLTLSGLVGFLVESRLRSVRVGAGVRKARGCGKVDQRGRARARRVPVF